MNLRIAWALHSVAFLVFTPAPGHAAPKSRRSGEETARRSSEAGAPRHESSEVAPTKASPPAADARTFAHQVLDLYEDTGLVTPEMRTLVEMLEKEARARVKLSPEPTRQDVRAVLTAFHEILTEHGFTVAPDGYVEHLTEALVSTTVNAGELEALVHSSYNDGLRAEWLAAHAKTGRVDVHLADCDTLSFLYLTMADAIGLPLELVERPAGKHGGVGHNWVQWRGPGGPLDWDALEAGPYWEHREPLTRTQALGYVRRLIGFEWNNRGVHGRAVRELKLSVETFPSAAALNLYAWLLATTWDPTVADPALARTVAQRAIESDCDSNNLDTAAAAYAAAGDFATAVIFERTAEQLVPPDKEGDRAQFQYRIALYERGVPYVQTRPRRQRKIDACLSPAPPLSSKLSGAELHQACLGLDQAHHPESWATLEGLVMKRPPLDLPASTIEVPKGCR